MKRIAAWNCADAFAKKSDALSALNADVAVVSEVRREAIERAGIEPGQVAWKGSAGGKGIAVICRKGWTVSARDLAISDIWYLAVVVRSESTEFQILGVWAQHKGVKGDPTFRTLENCADFIRQRPTIVAGDFNNNVNWDIGKKKNQFADTLSLIGDLGLRSAWHDFKSERYGEETAPTLYWRRSSTRVYHIDYVFLPNHKDWKPSSVEIGSYADWVASGLSDHAPVIVTL